MIRKTGPLIRGRIDSPIATYKQTVVYIFERMDIGMGIGFVYYIKFIDFFKRICPIGTFPKIEAAHKNFVHVVRETAMAKSNQACWLSSTSDRFSVSLNVSPRSVDRKIPLKTDPSLSGPLVIK